MSSAAPGWYPVEGDHRLRYWDGSQWTEHFHEQETATAVHEVSHGGLLPDDAIWSATGKPVAGLGASRYWLTPQHLSIAKGTSRTESQQVPLTAVVDVEVRQSMTQKARGVFTLLVQVNRGGHVESVSMDDIPDGRLAQRIILAATQQARLATKDEPFAVAQHGVSPTVAHTPEPALTQTTAQTAPSVGESWGREPWQQGVQAGAGSPPRDPMELLRMLADLRDAGVLTDDEFAVKKAVVLSRLG